MSNESAHRETLPSQPNWEMQQKRAKQLLRAVWAGDPHACAQLQAHHPHPPAASATKLADAQLAVARLYGFSSWAALKGKIDSLTKSPVEQFVDAVTRGDLAVTRELLQTHPEVRAKINAPLFSFDSVAVLQASKNLPLLDLLLEFGADINARSRWWAGGFGILEWNFAPDDWGYIDLEPAKALIERGAKVTVWAAAHLGLVDDLRSMIRANPQIVHARGGDGKQPLHCAVTAEIVDLLVDHGANLEARDIDHESTPLQYRIELPAVARRLIERGAAMDLFAAVALGDFEACKHCIAQDPGCVTHRLGAPPWVTAKNAGGVIYNWTLGHDISVLELARRRGNQAIYDHLLEKSPPVTAFIEAIWRGDSAAAHLALATYPHLLEQLGDDDRQLPARAAWQGNAEALKLALELGFDPHIRTVHESTPLDRAAFHGYADLVELLLQYDTDPPVDWKNAFGGTPLGACIYGAIHGWKTGRPQDHARTARLLANAGSKFDYDWLPTGNDEVDCVLREELTKHR